MIMVVSSDDSMSMLQPKTKTKPLPSSLLSSSFVNQNPFNPLPDSFRSEAPNSSPPSLLFSSIAHRPRTGIAALADHPESNSKCNNHVDDNNKSCHHSRKTWKQLIPLAAVSSATRPTLLPMNNNNNDNINNNESLLLVNRIEICRTNQASPPTSHTATTFEQTDDNQMVKLIKSVTNTSGTSGLTQTSPTMNCVKLQQQQPPNANMSTTISNNKSTRNDTLLDRKAFISLEKSINWQSILVNTNIVDDVVDSASTFNCGDGNTSSSRTIESSFPAKTTSETMEFSFPGMKHVPSWLKLLRLHKYAPIFAHMSYEEMMNLTEHDLERRNITKGARQKLYLSIQKLKARSAVLLASEQQLLHWNSKNYRKNITYSELSQVLFQIRAFLSTPIRATTTKDYPTMDHPSTTRTLDPTFDSYLVDVNNNNSSNHVSNNLVSPSPRDKFQTIIICWSMLTNNDLPSIIVRLLGHVVNIWTLKCRRHLQQLNLWQDYFREFYDKSSILDILFELNCETNKRRRTKMNEFDSDADEDDGHDEDEDDDHEKTDDYFSKQTSGHESDKENQDDGFIVVGHNRSVLNNNSRSSGRPTTSADVDGGSLENGDDDTKSDGPCPMVKLNIDREELYNMLKRIIDECLLHEAFRPHQTLLLHLLEQLKYLFFALKIIINVDSNQTMHEPQTFTASSNPTNLGNHSDMLNNSMLLDGHKTNHHLFQQPNQPNHQRQQPQSSDPDNLQCNQCPCVTSNIITTGNQPNHQRHQQNQYCCHHHNNNNEFGGSMVALRLSSTSNQRQSNISGVSSSNASNMMVSSDNYHHHHHHNHYLQQQQHSFSLKQKMNNGGQHQSSLTSIANNSNNHHANGRRLSTNNCTNKNQATEKSGKNLQYPQQNNHHYHQNNHHRSYRHNNGNNRTRTNSSIMAAQQKTYQDNHHNVSGNRLSSFGDSLENNTHSDNNHHHHFTKRSQNNQNIVGQNGFSYNNLQQNGSNQANEIQPNGLNVKTPNLRATNQHEPSFNDSKSSYKRSTPEMNLQNLLLQQLITVKNQYNHQQNNDHNYTNDWLNRGSSSSFNNLYSTTSSPLSSSSSSSTSNYCSKSPCDSEALEFENIGSPLFDGIHSNWFDFDQTNSRGKWTKDNEETSPSSFNSNDLQLLECIDWNFIEKSETFENFSKELDHHHYSSVHYDCFDDNRKLHSCFNYAGLRGSIDNLSEIPVTTTRTTTTAAQTATSSATAAMTSVTFDDIEQLSIRIAEHALEING